MAIGLLAVSVAHEGVHVGHRSALVGLFPVDLASRGVAMALPNGSYKVVPGSPCKIYPLVKDN